MRKLLTALSTLLSMGAMAQDSANNVLDPVTVTATRTASNVSESGRSISVISKEQIKNYAFNSLDELLRTVPGVEMHFRGAAGSQSDIIIRGATFQQVLVLIDGIKVNDPLTGHFSAYLPITPGEIERIEILKGPGSALYGSEAVGGVINIITKTFSPNKGSEGTSVDGKLSVGSYGSWFVQAGARVQLKKTRYSIGVLSNNADGQELRGAKGFFNNHTINASFGAELGSNWELLVRGAYDYRKFNAQNFYTSFVSDTAVEKVETNWAQMKLRQHSAKAKHEFDFVWKRGADNYAFNPKSIANDNRSAYWAAQYSNQVQVGNTVKANYGVQTSRRIIESNDRGNHATHNTALFGAAQYRTAFFSANAGLRLEFDDNFGTQLVPQLNITLGENGFLVKAGVGRAIRAADFTERFNNYNKTLVTGGSIGNPNLGTEDSWTSEFGLEYKKRNWKFGANYFFRYQTNVIDWVTTPYGSMPRKDNLSPTGTYALSKNLKQVETGGVELELAFAPQLSSNSKLFLQLSSMWLNSAVPGSNAANSFYVLSHANNLTQFNAIYQNKAFSISLNYLYKERTPRAASSINAAVSSSYGILNTQLRYWINKNIAVQASAINLGDVAYSDLLGSSMPGAWFSGGVEVKF
jgi:vitamin B12 transporter